MSFCSGKYVWPYIKEGEFDSRRGLKFDFGMWSIAVHRPMGACEVHGSDAGARPRIRVHI